MRHDLLTVVKRTAVRRSSSNSSLQTSALRGPPRKPKQSGHALWVGNLPPGTHILDLKDHFSRDATDDIESVFLISKSNCAFVNYKAEASCVAAMTRFHDSRFQGVRLVCRLRRGSSSTPTQSQTVSQQAAAVVVNSEEGAAGEESAVIDAPVTAEPEQIEKVKEKFFVVKSLTVEDLERSVVSGIWATQAHNENALNTAYQVSERF
jgi:RNA recognition motif-containing protein